MPHRLCLLLLSLCLLLAAGCPKQSRNTDSPPPPAEQTVRTMLSGLDQFPEEGILSLETSRGVFVVGPDVTEETRTRLYGELVEARDQVLTIRYRTIPRSGKTMAHNRVTGLTIGETPFSLAP